MSEPVETVEIPQTVPDAPEGEPDTFPRSYVEELRAESAANRVKAGKTDEAMAALYDAARQLATAGILHDPKDLPNGDYTDEETGLPSADKMRTAAIELAEAKPYLARVRGPIEQGPRGEVQQSETLAGMLRAAAR